RSRRLGPPSARRRCLHSPGEGGRRELDRPREEGPKGLLPRRGRVRAVSQEFTMTDSEWESASEPHAMLESLQRSGRPSARKLRLFAVACSRRMWDSIDTPGRMAVEVAERFADGSAGPEELRAARLACQGAGGQAAWYAAATNAAVAARNAARSAQAGAANHPLVGSEVDELLAQAQLVREIFGNRLPHSSAEPSWLTPSVVTMAQAIYDQR